MLLTESPKVLEDGHIDAFVARSGNLKTASAEVGDGLSSAGRSDPGPEIGMLLPEMGFANAHGLYQWVRVLVWVAQTTPGFEGSGDPPGLAP